MDGRVNQPPFAQEGTEIQVIYSPPGGSIAQSLLVAYAGAAPGEISGVLQVNFMAPPQSSTLTMRAGKGLTQFSVAIQ
jgi:hypothetical protein